MHPTPGLGDGEFDQTLPVGDSANTHSAGFLLNWAMHQWAGKSGGEAPLGRGAEKPAFGQGEA